MTRTVLLALDTSTEFCSVALLLADAPPATGAVAAHHVTASTHTWLRHEATGAVSSTRLLPAIRELFDEARLALSDCTAIAFGSGPGSFTGLRTATGAAQGLAFGLGVPVVPVGTLLACAEFARLREPSVTRVLAALDARMDEVYWADFEFDTAAGDWRTIRPASLDAPERARFAGRAVHARGQCGGGFRRTAAGGFGGFRASMTKRCRTRCRSRSRVCAGCAPVAPCRPNRPRRNISATRSRRPPSSGLEARAAKDAQGKQDKHEEPVR